VILSKILSIINLIRLAFKAVPKKEAEVKPEEPVKFVLTKEHVQNLLVDEFMSLVGIDEDKGPNRSVEIDAIIKSEKGTLGDPYCSYTLSSVVSKVCAKLSVDYPSVLYRGGSSQGWLKSKHQYIKNEPARGYAFVQTNIDDPIHGHVGLCVNGFSNGVFPTVEANTDNVIKTRFDRSMKNTYTKKMSGFVDIAQAIYDEYLLVNSDIK